VCTSIVSLLIVRNTIVLELIVSRHTIASTGYLLYCSLSIVTRSLLYYAYCTALALK